MCLDDAVDTVNLSLVKCTVQILHVYTNLCRNVDVVAVGVFYTLGVHIHYISFDREVCNMHLPIDFTCIRRRNVHDNLKTPFKSATHHSFKIDIYERSV